MNAPALPRTTLEAAKKLRSEIATCLRFLHAPDREEQAAARTRLSRALVHARKTGTPLDSHLVHILRIELEALKKRRAVGYVPPRPSGPIDVMYVYQTSPNEDFEIRYSLRSIERFAPYIRKVWVFGDRPHFLPQDTAAIEHVPETRTAQVAGVDVPVKNHFLLQYLASLIPGLAEDYLLFCDDIILLKPYSSEEALKQRYISNMAFTEESERGESRWARTLWYTYDALMRLEYTGYNFATHVPTHLTRSRVFDAFHDFRDFITEDRWYGMEWTTGVLNHAYKKEAMCLTPLEEENSRCGFWGKPPSYRAVVRGSNGRQFFNFDDFAFDDAIRKFLETRFPLPSRFEGPE